ncbi:hypothetical protein [Bradyrhizobium nanningense]|nr:hypothetical protein [Bradyrhizobium nanningense]
MADLARHPAERWKGMPGALVVLTYVFDWKLISGKVLRDAAKFGRFD